MKRKDLDLEQIKQGLEERRAVLLARLRVKGARNVNEAANPDRSDLAQDYFLKERNSVLLDRLEDTLDQVEEALERIEKGKYGKCQECGGDIAPARLEALPYAELCIACQSKHEN
jgi:RNA polymerase-binding protein DksA